MDEARCEAPTPRADRLAGAVGLANECAKDTRPRDVSYIDHDPAKQVVLSPRLQGLVQRVGGCQTGEVLALVRGIMYEVLQSRKY